MRLERFLPRGVDTSRVRGATIVTAVCCVITLLCSLSVGAVEGLRLFGMSIMDICDFLTAQILLPVGSLLTCIFLGWIVPKKVVRDEFTNWQTVNQRLFALWLFFVRVVCPICIIAVFLHQAGVI